MSEMHFWARKMKSLSEIHGVPQTEGAFKESCTADDILWGAMPHSSCVLFTKGKKTDPAEGISNISLFLLANVINQFTWRSSLQGDQTWSLALFIVPEDHILTSHFLKGNEGIKD